MSEKDWTKGFVKMFDTMPVITFTQRFQERMMKAAVKKYGDVIPNDRYKLYELAKETLETFKP